MVSGRLRLAAQMAALALAYFVSAWVGIEIGAHNEHATAVWPPTGIAVAALVLGGRRLWPGVAAGALAIEAFSGMPLTIAAGMAVGNTLAPLAAAYMLERLSFRATLDAVRHVVWLILVAGGAMTISATGGAAFLTVSGLVAGQTLPGTWLVWWVGDVMGVLLVAPFVLLLLGGRIRPELRARGLEATAMMVASLTGAWGLWLSGVPIRHLALAFAVWGALRFGPSGAAVSTLLISIAGITYMVGLPSSTPRDLVLVQGLNAMFAVASLSLAGLMRERDAAAARLRELATSLEASVAERTSELSQANDRLKQAQRLARIGSFYWDARTDTNSWTDELYHIYHLDPATPAPDMERYLSYIDPEARPGAEAKVQGAIREGRSIGHTYPVILEDGTRKWVHAYVGPIKSGGKLVALQGTCQDVTESVEAERLARHSEERLRALLDSAPDALVLINAEGKIELTNDQTSKLLGYAPEELMGQPVEILLPEDRRELHAEHRHGYTSKPRRRPMGDGLELFARHKSGKLVAVDISLSPVSGEDGVLVFAAIRDATQRRAAESAMRDALEREQEASGHLRQLDVARRSFLTAVSHELRTPLTAIIGYSDLMDEILPNDDPVSDMVHRLQSNARRLSTLLADLLDLDRLHRGIFDSRRAEVDVRGMILRVLGGIDLRDHGLRVVAVDGTAMVDPAQAERILENLVTNAVKYSSAGSSIEVKAEIMEDRGLSLVVSDDGPGVPEGMRAAIFEPFYRAEAQVFAPGTGIGLSLVDRFARLHGGKAWVADSACGGAAFHVLLPGRPSDRALGKDEVEAGAA